MEDNKLEESIINFLKTFGVEEKSIDLNYIRKNQEKIESSIEKLIEKYGLLNSDA